MDEPDEALDALPDGVLVADAEGRVVVLNAAARAMLAVEGDGAGRPLRDVLALQDRDGKDWWSANEPYDGLATRVGLTEQSWILPGGDEVLVTGRLERTGRAGPVRRVGVVLRSARGRERLDRERSDLVATVAHELRSPLTGVRGFVTTLLNRWDVLNDEQRKLMLETVNNDAERLGRLITELLDVARIDTGRLPLYRRDVDIKQTVDRVVASSRIGTSREFEVTAPDEVPTIFADPDKLVQVVTNLVENAVRHGEGTTRVALAATDEVAGGGVRITVDDEGEGIPQEMRKRVFTKFWKHGQRGGTGLGMYIVNGLVGVHGGTLTIGDSPSGGARITVLWPSTDPRDD